MTVIGLFAKQKPPKGIGSTPILSAIFTFCLLFATPSFAKERILILGASNTWGCVNDCFEEVETEEGYVKRLRTLLGPDYEIKVVAWFGAGVMDWDPKSVSVKDNSLIFPHGLWEEGTGFEENLWHLMAEHELRLWKPDYVVTFIGFGDFLCVFRDPPRPQPTMLEFKRALRRINRHIIKAGAIPVNSLDGHLPTYQQAILEVCEQQSIECGPNTSEILSNPLYFVGADGVHPNVAGHQAVAEAFAAWFNNQ